MAAATFDLKGTNGCLLQPQTVRAFEHSVDVDAATVAAGVGFGAGESAEFYTTPAGALVTALEAYVLTAAGGTETIDIGDEADPDGWLDGGNANGTAGTRIAQAGTEAYRVLAAQGKYYAAATGLRLTSVNANAVMKVRVVIRGTMVDLT